MCPHPFFPPSALLLASLEQTLNSGSFACVDHPSSFMELERKRMGGSAGRRGGKATVFRIHITSLLFFFFLSFLFSFLRSFLFSAVYFYLRRTNFSHFPFIFHCSRFPEIFLFSRGLFINLFIFRVPFFFLFFSFSSSQIFFLLSFLSPFYSRFSSPIFFLFLVPKDGRKN